MRVFENESFADFYDRGGNAYADLEFRKCSFVSCRLSVTRDVTKRSLIQNVAAIKCEVAGCAFETAIVRDCAIDSLKTKNPLISWGAVFEHVVIKGRIGRIMLSPAVASGTATAAEQARFDEANAAFYSGIDWALDISAAEFQEADIRGIPARLIRRDHDSQAIVTREKALEGAWKKVDLSETWWGASIQMFIDRPDETDVVLVAPKRSNKYAAALEGLRRLREAGVAE